MNVPRETLWRRLADRLLPADTFEDVGRVRWKRTAPGLSAQGLRNAYPNAIIVPMGFCAPAGMSDWQFWPSLADLVADLPPVRVSRGTITYAPPPSPDVPNRKRRTLWSP